MQGKSPVPKGVTGHQGLVTNSKIAEWIESPFWGGCNVGLRAERWIGIDVDHGYEYTATDPVTGQTVTKVKDGATQLAELEERLGPLPATITSTARGAQSPSRQHFYQAPDGFYITKPAEDIELIQRGHRYSVVWPSIHPDSGTQYEWYGYEGERLTEPPRLEDFEQLPQAWLDYLRADPPAEHEGFTGGIRQWLDALPGGEPSPRVHAFIRDIPDTDFGHDQMTALSFRLVRLGAENETGIEKALDHLYAAWTRPPYEDYGPALVTAMSGAIKKAGKRQPQTPPLIPIAEAFNGAPAELLDLVQHRAEHPVDHRRKILSLAYESGLSDSAALTLAWESKAGEILHPDPFGIETLWREALAVRVAPVVRVSTEAVGPIKLLSDEERAFVAQEEWWGKEYLRWVEQRVDYYNAPFHRLGRWAALSVIASPWGVTAIKGSRPTNAALYMAIPAPSTVGKTDALEFISRVVDAYYGMDDSPNLGMLGKLTSNALHRALLVRDGEPAYVYTDEGQAFLRDIQENKWQGTLLGDIAGYYGHGIVGAKQMMNDKEMSGKRGSTFLTLYMTGIDDQMSDAMDLSMWTSGLFYRFIWAIADPRQEDKKEDQADPSFAGSLDPWPRQWAAMFEAMKRKNAAIGTGRMVTWEDDAWDRHDKFYTAIKEVTKGHHRYERVILPALTRFSKSIIKCATLLALVEAEPKVTMRHALIAIEQAEEWLAALIKMVDLTSESKYDREVEEIYEFIGKEGKDEDVIFQTYRPQERADRMLKQLVREGRIVCGEKDISGKSIVRWK